MSQSYILLSVIIKFKLFSAWVYSYRCGLETDCGVPILKGREAGCVSDVMLGASASSVCVMLLFTGRSLPSLAIVASDRKVGLFICFFQSLQTP